MSESLFWREPGMRGRFTDPVESTIDSGCRYFILPTSKKSHFSIANGQKNPLWPGPPAPTIGPFYPLSSEGNSFSSYYFLRRIFPPFPSCTYLPSVYWVPFGFFWGKPPIHGAAQTHLTEASPTCYLTRSKRPKSEFSIQYQGTFA